jgi:hypothetical protein
VCLCFDSTHPDRSIRSGLRAWKLLNILRYLCKAVQTILTSVCRTLFGNAVQTLSHTAESFTISSLLLVLSQARRQIRGHFCICVIHMYRKILIFWPIEVSALHGGRCSADCEGLSNFADESVCLISDSVWIKGRYLLCGPLDGIMFHGEQCGSCVVNCL